MSNTGKTEILIDGEALTGAAGDIAYAKTALGESALPEAAAVCSETQGYALKSDFSGKFSLVAYQMEAMAAAIMADLENLKMAIDGTRDRLLETDDDAARGIADGVAGIGG